MEDFSHIFSKDAACQSLLHFIIPLHCFFQALDKEKNNI
jgi:hypothetical protein